MKFAICNELFAGWDFADTVGFIKQTGYDAIELAPFTFADSVAEISCQKRREIRKITEDAGLAITGIHWLLVKPKGLHINHPNPLIRRRTVAYLQKLIDFCGDVGGNNLIFGSPEQRQVLPGISREAGWQYTVESFAACGEIAAARNVVLCLEALPRNLTNILNTNEEVLTMVKTINHPNIRMMLDVKSMCAEEKSIPENIHHCAGYFEHFHANDANLRGPGFGAVDFVAIFAALRAVHYDQYVSVEVFDFTPTAETIAVESLAYMQKSLQKAMG
jgi:sugar phosphate isomerase/epimerase